MHNLIPALTDLFAAVVQVGCLSALILMIAAWGARFLFNMMD